MHVFVLGLMAALGASPPSSVDILIRNARVVDGTGAPWYRADVAVSGGRIAAIGNLSHLTAGRVIDAAELVLAPGFIDLMGQTGRPFLEDPKTALNLLTQGITTLNAGEGDSDAPLGDDDARRLGWRTMREFLARLEAAGIPMNVAQTVGHTQVREIVLGDKDRKATPDEMERMKALVREAMEAGAIGVSTSLIYPPAVYAPEEEITELARVAGRYGGRYFTHMRNEGDRLLEAIEEALRIGKAAGVPVHIFHLKAAGQANWGKTDLAIARIREARASGQEVGADVYPYVNNGLGIRALIHPRHSAEGADDLKRRLADPKIRAEIRREMETGTGWENWFRHAGHDWDRIVVAQITDPTYEAENGKSVGDIARAARKDPWDVFFDLARAPGEGASAMPQSMSEANKIKEMREPFTAFDTDAGPARLSHPRGAGAFPRVLSRYVRELGALTLEEAVNRMSAVAANEILAYDRGRIAPGLAADLVLLNPLTVRDRATFAEPKTLSEGVKYVFVNGVIVIDDGVFTGAKPGRVLRGPGYRERLTEAEEAYEDGLRLLETRTDEGMRKSLERFESAVAANPRFAPAHAAVATSACLLALYSLSPPAAMLPRAKSAAREALRLDDRLARAHAALGLALYLYDWNWTEAEESFKRSFALDPADGTVHHWYAMLLTATGRHEEAVREMDRALALEPDSLIINVKRGTVLTDAGRLDEAEAHFEKASERFSRSPLVWEERGFLEIKRGRWVEALRALETAAEVGGSKKSAGGGLALAYARLGRTKEAREVLRTLESPMELALAYVGLGEEAKAVSALENGEKARDPRLVYINVKPGLEPLRRNAAFQKLLARMALAGRSHVN